MTQTGPDTEGTLLRDLPTTLTSPTGMTVLGGRLLIADTIGDELWEIDPDGADTEGTLLRDLPTTLTGPVSMAALATAGALAAVLTLTRTLTENVYTCTISRPRPNGAGGRSMTPRAYRPLLGPLT